MNHIELLKLYGVMFQFDDTKREMWAPYGKDSIRVRYQNKMELIFTYRGPNDWNLETSKKSGKV